MTPVVNRRARGNGGQRGAATVELAIAAVGLLTLVALIIDGCLLFHRNSLLTETGATLARKISAEVARSPLSGEPCLALCERAQTLIEQSLESAPSPEGFSFTPVIIGNSEPELGSYAPYPLIRIDAVAPARCIFCSLIPWEIELKSLSLLVIERANTGCLVAETSC